MKIAVTGASGFLGRSVVRMAAERGHDVVATGRGHAGSPGFGSAARFVPADITDAAALAPVVSGCEVVVHAAALSSPWGRKADFEHVNIGGAQALVAAAAKAGVRRIVHVSSSSVYFAFMDQLAIPEDAALPPPVNAYAATKRGAETAIKGFGGEVFIVRPRGLFGPGDPHLLPRLLRVADRGPLPLLREGRARLDLTHVDVAAHALLAMCEASAAAAGTYNIAHGEPIAVRDLVDRLMAGLGRRLSWRRLPVGPALAGARVLEAMARLDPRGREPIVTAYGLGLFAFSHTLDIAKAKARLAWSPPIGLDRAIDATVLSFRSAP